MGIFDRNADSVKRERLEELCQIVALSFQQFRKAGKALREIRDEQLYRVTHETFDVFCRERWGITKEHASRLISADSVCEMLGPAGELIENENQARQVRKLDPQQLSSLVEEVTANNSTVADALKKTLPIGIKSKKGLKPIRFKLPGCTLIIEPNKKFPGIEETISHLLAKLEKTRDAA